MLYYVNIVSNFLALFYSRYYNFGYIISTILY